MIPRTLATLAAALLLTGCGANPPQARSGEQTHPATGATLSVTTADNVAATRAESRRLLTVLAPPDGGKIVSTSPVADLRHSQLGIGPSDPKFSEHAWWTVPMSPAHFAAWLRDQHVAGMKGQDGGSSSVPSGAMMPYFEFDGEGTAAYVRPILNLGWLPYGDGVAVRLDTFTGARFARTVLVPTDTTSVAIRRTVTSFNPRTPASVAAR